MTVVKQSPDAGQVSAPGQVESAVLRWQWDAHAREWIEWVRAPGRPDSYFRFHGDFFLSMVPKPGRLTLDIGCGEGRVGRDLRRAGHRVLGIDCSRTMCTAAASHPDFRDHPESTRVIAGDAATLPLADSSADCAIAFMCLQDIDDMPGTLKEIARVLEGGKQLALAIVHPMYSHGKASGIGSGAGKDVSVSRDYFARELRMSTDQWGDLTVTFYREHRPLNTYMTALLDAGFAIDQWHEVTETDRTRPNHRLPMFIDILATKKPSFATKKPPEIPHAVHDVMERQPGRHPGNSCPGGNQSVARRLAVSARRCTAVVPQSITAGRKFGLLLIFGALVLAMLRS